MVNDAKSRVKEITIDQAREFFADRTAIKAKLDALGSVGLGYLTLGQSTSILSGGEAQRLKLAAFLIEESRSKGSLFIFDEPTTGLHLEDVHTLIGVLDGLSRREVRRLLGEPSPRTATEREVSIRPWR